MNTVQLAKRVYHTTKLILSLPCRNRKGLNGEKSHKNTVNLEWVDNGNLGDSLGPVIYNWMLQRKGLSVDQAARKTFHLFTCGSLIGVGIFDTVIWGSGIHIVDNIKSLLSMKGIREYDIRAVRGPVTERILLDCGYQCPDIYGDPAILMPFIYQPENSDKKQDVSLVLHYYLKNQNTLGRDDCHLLNIATADYRAFINEICESRKVISSSLHGIILAETYGVPAVFLNTGGYVDKALLKYYDWYYSTGRYNVKIARTVEEALEMEPMPIPNLSAMQSQLMEAFPYDLWGGG